MAATDGWLHVRVPKAAEVVAETIRVRIVRHDLHQGDALPSETELTEEFGVSRPTLREAFRILESEGLITVRRGARGGARVQEPSSDVAARYAGLVLEHRGATLADVLDTRIIVEAPAAGILAGRRDRATSARILDELLADPKVTQPAHFHEFNARVVELTGNQTLILVTTMIERISRLATAHYVDRSTTAADTVRLSRRATRSRTKLIMFIRAGDAAAAEAHWRSHLREAAQILVAGAGDAGLALHD